MSLMECRALFKELFPAHADHFESRLTALQFELTEMKQMVRVLTAGSTEGGV
jgi:hypothetical protein